MVYGKTQVGQLAFKSRSPLFSARQRMAFILFDGQKSVEQILRLTAGSGVEITDIDSMLASGFLAAGDPVGLPEPLPLAVPEPATAPAENSPLVFNLQRARSNQQRYQDAYPLATQLTAGMGLRGFRLNLAVESAAGFEDLLKLLPRIQEALGVKACESLEQALKE